MATIVGAPAGSEPVVGETTGATAAVVVAPASSPTLASAPAAATTVSKTRKTKQAVRTDAGSSPMRLHGMRTRSMVRTTK